MQSFNELKDNGVKKFDNLCDTKIQSLVNLDMSVNNEEQGSIIKNNYSK